MKKKRYLGSVVLLLGISAASRLPAGVVIPDIVPTPSGIPTGTLPPPGMPAWLLEPEEGVARSEQKPKPSGVSANNGGNAKSPTFPQKDFWPGMWLCDAQGMPRIHVYSNGKRSSGVPALIQLAKHKDAGIRESAIGWLGAIGPDAKAAIPTLNEALKDPVPRVRKEAADAIREIQGGSNTKEAGSGAKSGQP